MEKNELFTLAKERVLFAVKNFLELKFETSFMIFLFLFMAAFSKFLHLLLLVLFLFASIFVLKDEIEKAKKEGGDEKKMV